MRNDFDSVRQDFECFWRAMMFDKIDVGLILKERNSKFLTYEILPRLDQVSDTNIITDNCVKVVVSFDISPTQSS